MLNNTLSWLSDLNMSNNTSYSSSSQCNKWEIVRSDHQSSAFTAWYNLIILTVSSVGILGNSCNLIHIFNRKNLTGASDIVKKSATIALISLTVSDLLFCLAIVPHTVFASRNLCEMKSSRYALYYRTISTAVINLFLMTTSLIVTLTAYMRYIAVTLPLNARNCFILRNSHIIIVTICGMCAMFTSPHFVFLKVSETALPLSTSIYCISYRFDEVITNWIRRYKYNVLI